MTRLEDKTHRAIVDLLSLYERAGKLTYLHVPNGGKRNPREGANLKRLGMRKGAPDLIVFINGGRTVFLEVKAPRGKTTPEQLGWLQTLNDFGYTALLVRSVTEAQLVSDRELGMKRAA